ncbi:hypothetical protein [Flavobacterium aquatile]|uniref:DUF1508 domain-containing protein n=1 Tax=Flavobacterium aquatile LMG 4008 = ATCC 11947 TaxID=1453498 RepID=A0A095SY05_9FLAO|nr:hypothetical protein [Flavobacterium aquatile]KGD69234.1 hypothetical protein LG45_00165 [Flavobacterium aquatile LMG 4008 = ATCC 11947]OXA69487.1 DUF1508 domain-containing protein [Flavobacterium aquatile LMG 4008 = ATCC 11947]GEC79773.1 hypothetical protein FAQ01_26430 [Flavobacterium aquatile]
MGTFVITKRLNGFYKYEFTSRKGKTIFISNDFELRFECEEDIDHLKSGINEVFFMKFKSKNGKLYFKIILKEREVAVSRKYTTQLLLQKGIDEIIRTISKSEILDFSSSDDIFPPAEDVFGVL